MKETKDFEQKLKRLEEVVSLLEREERSLEDTLSLFKEGMKLSKECRKTLAEVELSVTRAAGADENGEIFFEEDVFKDDERS